MLTHFKYSVLTPFKDFVLRLFLLVIQQQATRLCRTGANNIVTKLLSSLVRFPLFFNCCNTP